MYPCQEIYKEIQFFAILEGIMQPNNELVFHSLEYVALSKGVHLLLLGFDSALLKNLHSVQLGYIIRNLQSVLSCANITFPKAPRPSILTMVKSLIDLFLTKVLNSLVSLSIMKLSVF
jgi:hypothetical protein